jgi:serine/threonine-protein kinase
MPAEEKTVAIGDAEAGAEGGSERLTAGLRVGDYVLEAPIAQGAHGAVWAARHHLLGHRAAIKVLRRELAGSDEMVARFAREARVVSRIGHPEIVEVHDVGVLEDGRPYCAMELLDGQSLLGLLRERGARSPAEAVALLAPVCRALQAAHEAGVVHRDVKASNVMVLSGPGAPRVKLLDFGVAKAAEPGGAGLTAVGQRLGSPVAMAPEQIVGQPVDARADVYALGVLLFQLLTGRTPFFSPDPDELEDLHLDAAPPRPSDLAPVPPALDAVVLRALEKTPSRRWPSAAAMLEAATAALAAGAPAPLRPAIAVRVSLALEPAPGDEALLAQAEASERAEAALRAEGFALALATPATVLGVRVLPGDPAEARRARAAAVGLARRLADELPRTGASPAIAVVAGAAEVREGAEGLRVAGGPICAAAERCTGGRLAIAPDVIADADEERATR